MKQNLGDFANRNPVIWAVLMALLASILASILFVITEIGQSNDDKGVEDSNPTLTLIMMLFCFLLGGFFFKSVALFKKITFLGYLAINILFITVYISIMIFFTNHIEELDSCLNFISVKQWSEDGYAPPEEVLSDEFSLFILVILTFLTTFVLNIFPNSYLVNSKKVNYFSLILLTLTIAIIIYIMF